MYDDANNRSVSGTAAATVDAASGVLHSVGVCGGADAATITVYTGGNGGTVLCKLGVAAGISTQRLFAGGVPYSNLYLALTGTTPQWDVEI